MTKRAFRPTRAALRRVDRRCDAAHRLGRGLLTGQAGGLGSGGGRGGFNLKIQPVEFASLLDQEDRGDFELVQLGWSGRVDPDADITNFVGTGGSQNVSGFSDPSLDSILGQARQSQDLATRRDLYAQSVAKIQAADPLVYLYRQRNLTGVSNTVKGVQVFPDGVIRVAMAGLAK
jgi:peptide/nickel transport system substrate-binding protein